MSAAGQEPLSRGALVLIAGGVLALAGCGQSPSESSDPAGARVVARSGPGASAQETRRERELDAARRAAGRDDPADAVLMPSGLHADPDPRIRLEALEMWAMRPGRSLDPVTHAMVDPDERVRARAQDLFEEALARR